MTGVLTTGPTTSSHVGTDPMVNVVTAPGRGAQGGLTRLRGVAPATATVRVDRNATASPVANVETAAAAVSPPRPDRAARSRVARHRAEVPVATTVRMDRNATASPVANVETAAAAASTVVVAPAARAAMPAEPSRVKPKTSSH